MRIDVKWPSARLVRDDGIFNGECILREPIYAPVSDLDGVAEYSRETECTSVRDFALLARFDPLFSQPVSEDGVEGSQVSDHS